MHVTYVGNFLSAHGLNPTYSESLVPRLVGEGIRIRAASRRLNPALRFLDTVCALLGTPANDSCIVVDLYSGPRAFVAAYLVACICRITEKPYVIVLHGGRLPDRLRTSRARLLHILTGARRVVSPSRYLAAALGAHVQVEVIPNALDVHTYPYRTRRAATPRLLYLRAFHRNYGPTIAVKSLALVRQQYPDAQLTMIGPDIDGARAECLLLVKELQLDGAIEFQGRISKEAIPHLSSKYDIFLNPTFVDNTPVSVVEAMAMGMCIVATRAGGLPYLLEEGETALLVEPGDETAMAAAVVRLLRDPLLASRLSTNARLAAEQMDWAAVTPAWVRLLDGVVRSVS